MTLREFLNEFDFDYEKDQDGNYKLIDLQGAYLGGIGSEVFTNIPEIVDRLSTYYTDYIYQAIIDNTISSRPLYEGEEIYDTEMLEWLKENYGADHYITRLVECIVNPELIEEDE